MVSFERLFSSQKKKKNAQVPSSFLSFLSFPFQNNSILKPLVWQSQVCIQWKVSSMECYKPIIVRGHPCEGWSILTRLLRTWVHLGGHLCKAGTTAMGDWLQSNRVDQIGKYFKNNEKYISCQQRRKLQIQKERQFQLTLWHWIGIGNIGIH